MHATSAEVSALPVVDGGAVHEGQIDANRHMNVKEYFAILTDATITACGEYGLDLRYPLEGGAGLFSVDHHARYLRELRLGDAYTVHVRLVEATDKAVHTIAYLVQSGTGLVSSTLESLLLNVDLQTRRVTPFDAEIRERLKAGLVRSLEVGPPPAGCGAIRTPGTSLA